MISFIECSEVQTQSIQVCAMQDRDDATLSLTWVTTGPALAGRRVFSDRIVQWSLLSGGTSLGLRNCDNKNTEGEKWFYFRIFVVVTALTDWLLVLIYKLSSWWNFRFVQRLRVRLFSQQSGSSSGPTRSWGTRGWWPCSGLRLAEGGISSVIGPW